MLPVLQDLIIEYTGRTFRLQKESLRIYLDSDLEKKSYYLDFKVKPGVWTAEWGPWLYTPPGKNEVYSYRSLVLHTGTEAKLPAEITIPFTDFERQLPPVKNVLLCSDKPLLEIKNVYGGSIKAKTNYLYVYLLSAYHTPDALVLLFGRHDPIDTRNSRRDVRSVMETELYRKAKEVLQELKIPNDGYSLQWTGEGYVYFLLDNGERDLPKFFTPDEIKRFITSDLAADQLKGALRVEFMGANNVGIKADDDDDDPDGVEENPIQFRSFHFPATQKLSDYLGSIGSENFEPTAYSVAKEPYLSMYYDALRKLDAADDK